MKMEEVSADKGLLAGNAASKVFKRGFEGFDSLTRRFDDFDDALQNLAMLSDKETERKITKLQAQVDGLQPSVTIIGQIKAGKTSLVNAMIGTPDLLPADVNPWTSVVTSLHVNTPKSDDTANARFKFFDEDEWDRLVQDGGRIGELASRAGADDELEKVREQIAQMREKTRARLGRKFELLLGQEHSYGYLDDDLIQRYVCMGDDDADGTGDEQGRFADITKSADLYIDRPEMPVALCLRDTPGVNDTFMMREQITMNAVRESRICAVVLSAHQALTSMDMALIRLISNVKSREILIFVNRIDELADPANQVPEIRNSIIETLRKNNAPADVEIVFGSAYWANSALSGQSNELHEDSAAALENWVAGTLSEEQKSLAADELAWEASGVPTFYRALAERISEGPGRDTLQKVARKAINLAHGLGLSNQVTLKQTAGATQTKVDPEGLRASLERIETEMLGRLNQQTEEACSDFMGRIDQSHERFLERATTSLIEHLETKGEDAIWQYSPMGLRLLLRSSFQVVSKKMNKIAEDVYADAARQMTELYTGVYEVSVEGFSIEPPLPPHIPPPVSVGQTIALDLQTSWWKGWWKRRRGYQAYAEDFQKLIRAETSPIVDDLKLVQSGQIRENAAQVLREFLGDQRAILMDVAQRAEIDAADLEELFGVTAGKERQDCLVLTVDELSAYAA